MLPPGPIVSLVYRIPAERRPELLAFLRDAVPFYERPGGTRVGLYESADDPGLYLELVAYADETAYAADQARVEHDAEMLATLARFRAVVNGPVEVRRMKPVALPDRDATRRTELEIEIEVAPAAYNDHTAIAALLADAKLPVPDGDDAPVRMLVARDRAGLTGCAGWERHGSTALLRSVAVTKAARRQGIGQALVRAAIAAITAEEAREVVLLTTDAEGFFANLGFTPLARAELPEDVRGARQVSTQCCATAACMRLGLGR